MGWYQKKPVKVEARQWDGTAVEATPIIDWILTSAGGHTARYHEAVSFNDKDGHHEVAASIQIHTLEGTMAASAGDFIIRGIKGEFYPCKPDIFADTYEEVADR